ncbi:MAG TPA: protein kinase [Pyrinomonadaceae bacterium]|jgi:serine/threonine-protein kinase
MDDQWQKVRAVFDAALREKPARRARFVAEACGGDESLRGEVESLLAALGGADDFLETPVAARVAGMLEAETETLARGARFSHYEIIKQIGAGGMGEVYLAKDLNLNRKVALKLLSPHINEDKTRVSRFRQEAFATSALNHPNIVTIFEIGKRQARDFIVTEFIDGETLRERLKKKKTGLAEALDIALQVASALAAAHGAGIVHRDIKPENVMIRRDGLVKVLDFGIAKYRPSENGQKALVETGIGEIIGTAAYMSPEQARGNEIDAQTDVWSLGVILYEMLAGRLPFQGATKADRIAAILEREPAPLTKSAPPLQAIIDRALAKNKKQRYAGVAELAEDLLALRETTGDKMSPALILPVRRRTPRRRVYGLAALSLLILLFGAALWLYFSGARKTAGGDKKSIVVLPLKPINSAARDELYEIGIADSLIQRLGSINGFVVRPLSAIRKYAEIEQDPLAAGREQQADYVLASNYQIAGGKVRVTAQLFNVETGQAEETYKSEKDANDVFATQDAIADEVGKLLQARFTLTSGTPTAKRGTENEEAYRLYLQGMYFNDKRTEQDAWKAIESFEQAVRLDPDYARAWAGIGAARRSLANGLASATKAAPERDLHAEHRMSMEAVNKALALDPNLSEAHSALCENEFNYEYDFAAAETARRRAVELDPNSAPAHYTYARLLFGPSKRFDAAIAEIKTAIDLDPTSTLYQIVYTVALTYARRYDEAARQLERLAERNPKGAVGYFWLVGGAAFRDDHAEDFERLIRFQKMAGTDEETIRIFTTAYQTAGWSGVLREQAKRSYDYSPNSFFPACLYAQLGDKDRALEYLEKTFQRREHWMAYLQIDPRLDNLRGDARFEEMIRRVESQ